MNNPNTYTDPSGKNYNVYGGYDAAGSMKYVGQTCRDVAVRAGEHLASGNPLKGTLDYRLLHQVPDLLTARGSEQSYIDKLGLSKNGGSLINQVNSIASSNPNLQQAKDQARALGAVPVATSVVGTIGEAVASVVKFPIIYVDLYAAAAALQANQPSQMY